MKEVQWTSDSAAEKRQEVQWTSIAQRRTDKKSNGLPTAQQRNNKDYNCKQLIELTLIVMTRIQRRSPYNNVFYLFVTDGDVGV